MWWDLVIDVLWPSRGAACIDRIVENSDSGAIPVQFRVPGEFKRRLNESGWLADEVIAAGELRQGKPHSPLALITGLALIEVLRPRRSKHLPRTFALAVTADRVVAFAMSAWSEGDGVTDHVVKIKRGDRGCWSRESARLIDLPKGPESKSGTLELAGVGRIPVTWDGDPSTGELIDLLGR
jgi:hypothetical protein